jgi:DNA-binding beta-propeller fold protein YncE
MAACLALAPASAQANRPLLSEAMLETKAPLGPPQGQIEGACGLAVTPANQIYVSDYYHRAVDRFSLAGAYISQIALPGGPIGGLGINSLDSVCGLAADSSGRLYANEWHQGVRRLLPSTVVFDEGHESTGVAVDPASGDVYVDDRTAVAVYEPSGAPVEVGGQPLRIGVGSIEDGYGLAVAGGRVYVPDAGTGTVKVFEPAVDPAAPVATISHAFVSLVDAAVAVDPTNGHVVVVDDTQPDFEHPGASLLEFDSTGAFLGQLACNPVDGQPSGLAFDSGGNLYVTNGNGEGSNVFRYGPYTAGAVPKPTCAAVAGAGGHGSSLAKGTSGVPAAAAVASKSPDSPEPAATASEVVQQGHARVSFDAALAPKRLPRHGSAPVRLSFSTEIAAVDGGKVPQLRRVTIGFNRAGHIDPSSLPACALDDIQPATTAAARAACGRSLVGQGTFSADVRLPQQSPFPSQGKVLAFNGRYQGHPAILAHVYGTSPVPTSYTLPFEIGAAKGSFGTVLQASLPEVTGDAAAITGLTLTLGRSVGSGGHHRSYVSAGCPAPAGFPGAVFPLARASFGFSGRTLRSILTRSCRARG